MKLEDRVVILTGATQGIGRATAFLLAKSGCKLALAARDRTRLLKLASQLEEAGHTAVAIPTDMGETRQARALARIAGEAYGNKIDVVINNAGIGVRDDVDSLKEVEARRVMDVNYFGPLALIQAALPYLKLNPDGGLIINVSSIVSQRAMPGLAGYCASKGALDNLTESLRLEMLPFNVRVSAVFAGVTATRFNDNSLGDSQLGRGQMAGVPPERVAKAIERTILREPRDVYITYKDQLFVLVSQLFPRLMDRMLSRYLEKRYDDEE
jgi:short-subunit dehydrogenase